MSTNKQTSEDLTKTVERFDFVSDRVSLAANGGWVRFSDYHNAVVSLNDARMRALTDLENARITIRNMQDLLRKKECK